MQRQETPPAISMGPQMFKDTLYGEAGTGWLTIFYTPSKQTIWFPVTAPVPALDLEQNCYLGLGIRRQRPDNDRARGKTDDIIGIPGLWLDLDYESPGAHKVKHPLPPNEDAVLSLLDAAPCNPSLIVHSGHGLGLLAVQGNRLLRHRPGYLRTTVPWLAATFPTGWPRLGLAR